MDSYDSDLQENPQLHDYKGFEQDMDMGYFNPHGAMWDMNTNEGILMIEERDSCDSDLEENPQLNFSIHAVNCLDHIELRYIHSLYDYCNLW